MNRKGFLQISFGWLFALIVGAFVLFMAIFLSVKLIGTQNAQSDAELGSDISVLLNPLQSGFEEGLTSYIQFPNPTRIYNSCYSEGKFGRQTIRTSQKTFGKWSEIGTEIDANNKYIFSDKIVEGERIILFSKPFYFPFKVADLIFMSSADKTYCFVGANEELIEELSQLNLKNIENSTTISGCLKDSEKVCFRSQSGCDTIVDENSGEITKEGKRVYFSSEALMYAGIFSDPTNYECQVKRLGKRVGILAELYSNKKDSIKEVGCSSNLNLNLLSGAGSIKESFDMLSLAETAKDLGEKNDNSNCKLW